LNNSIILLFLFVLFLFLTSCTSYVSEASLNNTADESQQNVSTAPTIRKFNIDETAANDKMSIKINSVKFVKNIISTGTFGDLEATQDKKFVIIDLTITNLMQEESLFVSSMFDSNLIDGEDYSYDTDYTVMSYLDRPLTSGTILPSMSLRGKMGFEVPTDAQDFTLVFRFGWDTPVAVFTIPNKEVVYSEEFDTKPSPQAKLIIEDVVYEWKDYEYFTSGYINYVNVVLNNTGKIAFEPSFDVDIIYDDGIDKIKDTDVSSDFYGSISPNTQERIKLSVLESIEYAGPYEIIVKVKENKQTKVLASASKDIRVE